MDLLLKEFFKLEIEHDYFKNGNTNDFSFTPFSATSRRLKNFHIFGKLLTSGFSLSIGVRNKEVSITDEIRDLGDLHFWLINKHEYLVNYTNFRFLDRMVEILYLSTGEGDHHLQQTNSVGNDHILNIRPLRFNVELTGSSVGQIRSADQDVLFEFEGSNIDGEIFPVDLRAFGDGKYELWFDGSFQESFFATNEEVPNGCLGVLHLNGDHLVERMKSTEKDLAFYELKFEAKSCVWEYEIALSDKRKIQINELRVDGKGVIDFELPRKEKFAGQLDLTVFASTEPKKLVNEMDEYPELIVNYSNLHSDRKSEMTIKLPVPDIKRVQTRSLDNDEKITVAPTLIYI